MPMRYIQQLMMPYTTALTSVAPNGFFRFSGVVADERQPRQRHGDRQFHRSAEGEAVVRNRGGLSLEDDAAQKKRQHKEGGHRHGVDFAEVLDADQNPQRDQHPDHQTPDPSAGGEDAVGRECAVIDHDGGPADELQHV